MMKQSHFQQAYSIGRSLKHNSTASPFNELNTVGVKKSLVTGGGRISLPQQDAIDHLLKDNRTQRNTPMTAGGKDRAQKEGSTDLKEDDTHTNQVSETYGKNDIITGYSEHYSLPKGLDQTDQSEDPNAHPET